MTAVNVERASVSYDGVRAVADVSAEVATGSWVALIGPNGAGKSSLLRAVAGLVPHTGTILLDGASVTGLGRRRLARLVAYLPQRPLVPSAMTVADYVLLGRTPFIPYFGTEGRRDTAVAEAALDRLELSSLNERPLGSLSGGELQRTLLGRALAQEAPVLLLDEPTTALDVGHQQQVLELLDELRFERELTVLSAMHDLTLAGQFADRLLLLDGGTVVAEGMPEEVLTRERIATHYGADVRVVREAWGLAVAPARVNRRGDR
jgi:iron complex transport system ATP-binding protein